MAKLIGFSRNLLELLAEGPSLGLPRHKAEILGNREDTVWGSFGIVYDQVLDVVDGDIWLERVLVV